MKIVKQLLSPKPHEVWSVSPSNSVYEALQLMAAKDIGAVLVVENSQVVGIFSERDYARKVILKGKASKETQVGELMTKDVLYVRPDQSLEDCMALMTEKHIRHLPVMEQNKLLGIVTIGDIVKAIISEQQFTIRELENYISGYSM
jgi:CBS domain-containing protein